MAVHQTASFCNNPMFRTRKLLSVSEDVCYTPRNKASHPISTYQRVYSVMWMPIWQVVGHDKYVTMQIM